MSDSVSESVGKLSSNHMMNFNADSCSSSTVTVSGKVVMLTTKASASHESTDHMLAWTGVLTADSILYNVKAKRLTYNMWEKLNRPTDWVQLMRAPFQELDHSNVLQNDVIATVNVLAGDWVFVLQHDINALHTLLESDDGSQEFTVENLRQRGWCLLAVYTGRCQDLLMPQTQ